MTIRHLEIFIVVADCGKMCEAADRLYISQPSVSQAIQEIETEYNVRLFERLNKKLFITQEGEINNPDIIQIPVYCDELKFVCSPEHPLAKKSSISIKELEGEDFIVREEGSSVRKKINKLFCEHKVDVNYRWSSSNTESMKAAVLSGLGMSIFSSLIIEKELNNGCFHILPIVDAAMFREITLLYHKDKFISRQMTQFIEVCKTFQTK